MKIGFFDSGLGGLTILKAVTKELPEYDYEFYGDTANLPYGDKSEEEIFELTKAGVEFLFNKECSLVIIACNTSSAETIKKLQTDFLPKEYPHKKVLGVIIPTIEAVLDSSPKQITILSTKRTAESRKYEMEFLKLKCKVPNVSISTPRLVPLIEGGEMEEAHQNVFKIINEQKVTDNVVLGCTHYTLLKSKLRDVYKGRGMRFFSQDEIIPEKLKLYLENHPEIKNELSTNKIRNIFLTKHSSKYDQIIQELLDGKFI